VDHSHSLILSSLIPPCVSVLSQLACISCVMSVKFVT
jgi:hypothetical protein